MERKWKEIKVEKEMEKEMKRNWNRKKHDM